MRLFENLWSRFLNVKCIRWLPKLTGNLEPWILFSLSLSIYNATSGRIFIPLGRRAASFICCRTHRRHSERLNSLGTRVCPGPGPCVQSQELCTRLWRGDRCDVMTYAGLFKLRSPADAARRMESDVFHGMEFTMGLSKTLGPGECLWSSKVVPILFRKPKKEKKI